MTRPLRLLADDLTGALDSAAAFGSSAAPLPVVWALGSLPASGAVAFDTGTRELATEEAARRVAGLAPRLFGGAGILAYKKIDSLLRGWEAEEIGAALDARPFRRCIVAPAFPAQGRLTVMGRQGLAGPDGVFAPLPVDLAARLEAQGRRVSRRRPGDDVPDGISFWDASDDRDLDIVAGAGALADDVLFVGSGGLAAALARRQGAPTVPARLAAPLLGLFGTDHPVMRGQLAAVPAYCLPISDVGEAPRLARRLAEDGAAFVTAALPANSPRAAAAARIAALFAGLVRRLDPPGTLLVAGGETLRALGEALGAQALLVTGEVMPGIPASILSGGRWHGTATVSKSGAFGAPDLLATLLAASAAPEPGARPS